MAFGNIGLWGNSWIMDAKRTVPPSAESQAHLTADSAFAKALDHFNAGCHHDASQLCAAILQAVPSHIAAINLLGVIAQKSNRHDLAAEQFSRAIKIDDSVALIHYNLGVSLYQSGNGDRAIEVLNVALEKEPANRLIREFLQSITDKPIADNLGADLQQAIDYHQAGAVHDAIAWYQKTLKSSPENVIALSNMGIALQAVGNQEAAIDCYQKATAIDPGFADAHFNLGNALIAMGKPDAAVISYQKALSIMPDHAYAQHNLGNTLLEQGRLAEAVVCFEKSIAIMPDFAEAHNNLGNAMQGLGQLEAAVGCYQRATAITPGWPEVFNNLGNVLMQLGQLDAAVDSYQKALLLKPGCAETHNNLGIIFLEQGRLVEGLANLQKALSINPGYAEAHNNLGNIFKKQGRLDAAVLSYQKSLAINPDFAKALSNLGSVLKEQGKLDAALISLQKAIAIAPDDLDSYNNLLQLLMPMCHATVCSDRDNSRIKQVINALPPSPEPSIIDFQIQSLLGEDCAAAWQNILNQLPTVASETLVNPQKTANLPTANPKTEAEAKIVAMLHFGRSGSGYLHSLLDSHPEVSTLPGVYMSGFFGRRLWQHLSSAGFAGIPEQVSLLYKVLFDARAPDKIPPAFINDSYSNGGVGVAEGFDKMGLNRDTPLTLDRTLFNAKLQQIINAFSSINLGQLFTAIHRAYDNTLTNSVAKRKIIFYHLHKNDPYSMANLLKYFPDTKLLLIIRDPLQSCESWIKPTNQLESTNGYAQYSEIVNKIGQMLIELNSRQLRQQQAVAVRLEDLKTAPRETMLRLCAFLGIEEGPTLYKSTMQGLQWWGDPSSYLYGRSHNAKSWDDDPIKAKVGKFFSNKDQFILGTLFYPLSAGFGYVKRDDRKFREDLKKISTLIDEPLEFELKLAKNFPQSYPILTQSSAYKYFHAMLQGRWYILDKYGTYPDMVKQLPIL